MKQNFKIITLILILLLTNGCQIKKRDNFKIEKIGRMHTSKEITNYIDNLVCGKNKKTCNLKNNYVIVDESIDIDDNGDEYRILTFKLIDFDLYFTAKSSYSCVFNFKWECKSYIYQLSTNYFDASENYFYHNFFKENNIEEECSDTTGYCYFKIISSKKDLDDFIDNYHKYINYINNIQRKTSIKLKFDDYTFILFDKPYNESFLISINELDNGIYGNSRIQTVEEEINNYMKSKHITYDD